MNTMVLDIIQLVIAALLVIAILLQNRGAGLGSAFGGEGGNVYHARRSFEKVIFYATIVLAIVFFAVAFINILY